jgi:hypothetical protein
MSGRLMETRIKDKFCVSTIYRQCSAIGSYGSWYYETMVFHLKDDGSLGAIADQGESHSEAGAVRTHNAFVSTFCSDLPEIDEQVERAHDERHRRFNDLGSTP